MHAKAVFEPVEFRRVWLDIKKRGAVQDVHTVKMQHIAFAADQFDNAQSHGIGTRGGARREHSSLDVLEKRLQHQFRGSCLVEVIDKVYV